MASCKKLIIPCLLIITIFVIQPAAAQISHISVRPLSSNILMPQSRSIAFAPNRNGTVEITDVDVLVDILEGTATTTIEVRLHNTSGSRQEAELIFPVPDGAVVRGFAYDGPGTMVSAQVLPKDQAKQIYQGLVAKIRDPALAEFIGYNLIRSSVFPVEANGRQKVRLTYEHLLETDGNRLDYFLPRTESLEYKVPWKIKVEIRSKHPISTIYSPTHKLVGTRGVDLKSMNPTDEPVIVTAYSQDGITSPGPFRLSYLLAEKGVSASMFAYPEKKVGGGYFLLLAGLPVEAPDSDGPQAIKREVTLVIDRSGSMRNEKLEQVKEACLQVIAGLKKGEAFNIIIYSNNVERFSKKPVIKTKETEAAAKEYVDGITATGGTNIYDALVEALSQEPTEGMLPIVLFLTDGLPTVGQTSELTIRNAVIKSNPYKRRVFTFGVGLEVNAPLLEKIADDTRAKSEFVLPKEDIEVKVGRLFDSLTGPVLSDVELDVLDADGEPAAGRTRDIIPDKLPDFYQGDQILLLGQYVGDKPITFVLKGNYFGRQRSFKFKFDFDKTSVKNGFVSRLWASRKIAELIDAIRQMGADSSVNTNDPKVKELVDEIVRLSTEFGILTEYTAFLAREGTNLERRDTLLNDAKFNFETRAMRERSGLGGVNQSFNMSQQKQQDVLNMSNMYLNKDMERVSVSSVQQINDTAYYFRNNRWIDSRLVEKESKIEPKKIVEYGSPEFIELATKLAEENRQGSIAFSQDVLLMVDGEPVLIKNKP
jgi:Ca-activated chloride channel homolog